MTHVEFKYWMQGFLILSDDLYITQKQYHIIKNHADLSKAVVGHQDEGISLFMERLKGVDKISKTSINDAKLYAKECGIF